MSEHSTGRLEQVPAEPTVLRIAGTGVIVANASGFDGSYRRLPCFPTMVEGLANARRIRAMWNTLAQFSTEEIERGDIFKEPSCDAS